MEEKRSGSLKSDSGHLWCTGVSEWTPAGVFTIFEDRSGAGVDFFEEGPEPESVF